MARYLQSCVFYVEIIKKRCRRTEKGDEEESVHGIKQKDREKLKLNSFLSFAWLANHSVRWVRKAPSPSILMWERR